MRTQFSTILDLKKKIRCLEIDKRNLQEKCASLNSAVNVYYDRLKSKVPKRE